MYKKRFLAAILAAALTASLASCGNNASNTGSSTPQESQTSSTEVSTPETPEVTSVDGDVNLQTYPIVEEKIELTLWYPMAGSMGELSDFNKDAEFWPWYEEKTNIHINFQIPAAGTETDAFQLLFASDAMPDLVYSQPGSYSYRGGEDKAIEDGYFIDMAEYLEYAPNYTSWLNNHDDFRTASYSDTGKMYGMWGLWKTMGEPTLGGYRLVMQNNSILISYMNTLIYVVCATAFGTLLTILAAYVMSRKNLYFKSIIIFIVTFTMIFNGGLIPTYMVVRNLGMLDTRWAMIIPASVTAYNIIIMRTSFAAVPDALSEAATIDGAGHLRILCQIILPVSKSIIAVIVLFYGIQHWNAWFNASIYLTKRELYPLQLTLREIVLLSSENSIIAEADGQDVEIYRPLIKYSTIMVSVIPMMVIYPFIQKYFVSGVMIGSVKG